VSHDVLPVRETICYPVRITIAGVGQPRWQAICKDCAGQFDSLMELLQGCLAGNVMGRVCRQNDDLLASPEKIRLFCACPDRATMSKHVAVTRDGVGACLGERPEPIFFLRGVNENGLISWSSETLGQQISVPESSNSHLGEGPGTLFGPD